MVMFGDVRREWWNHVASVSSTASVARQQLIVRRHVMSRMRVDRWKRRKHELMIVMMLRRRVHFFN